MKCSVNRIIEQYGYPDSLIIVEVRHRHIISYAYGVQPR